MGRSIGMATLDDLQVPAVVTQELTSQFTAFMSSIRDHGAYVGKQWTQATEQEVGCTPVRDVGRRPTEQSHRVAADFESLNAGA